MVRRRRADLSQRLRVRRGHQAHHLVAVLEAQHASVPQQQAPQRGSKSGGRRTPANGRREPRVDADSAEWPPATGGPPHKLLRAGHQLDVGLVGLHWRVAPRDKAVVEQRDASHGRVTALRAQRHLLR